jgi:uncharacterized integral membrane protein
VRTGAKRRPCRRCHDRSVGSAHQKVLVRPGAGCERWLRRSRAGPFVVFQIFAIFVAFQIFVIFAIFVALQIFVIFAIFVAFVFQKSNWPLILNNLASRIAVGTNQTA